MKRLIISGIVLIALMVIMSLTQNSSQNVVRAVGIAFILHWIVCMGLILAHAKTIKI